MASPISGRASLFFLTYLMYIAVIAGCQVCSPGGARSTGNREAVKKWLNACPTGWAYSPGFLTRDQERQLEDELDQPYISWLQEGKKIPGVEGTLRDMLRDEDRPMERLKLVGILLSIGTKESSSLLGEILLSPSEDITVREEAASALSTIRDPKSIDTLGTALQDRNSDLRCTVCRALARFPRLEAKAHLEKACSDSEICVRRTAEQCLMEGASCH